MDKRVLMVGIASFIFLLAIATPKVVVNENKEEMGQKMKEDRHSPSSDKAFLALDSIITAFKGASSEIEMLTVLDSLTPKLEAINRLDSLASYSELLAERYSSKENDKRCADAYFNAFTYVLGKDEEMMKKRANLILKSKEFYQNVLQKDSSDLSAQVGLGKIMMNTEKAPMAGILKIREIANQNPTFEEAQFVLGEFSLQSGQLKKAVNRFENVIRINPENMQAHLNLGYTYLQMEEASKAEKYFSIIEASSDEKAKSMLKSLRAAMEEQNNK